jgi:methylase of polypeptide subunit release factors
VKVGRALAETRERLTGAGCESPEVDAELIVAHLLGVVRSELALDRSRKL